MSSTDRRKQCTECPSSYELIPPADPAYSEPRMKSTSDDHIKLFYECDEQHHRNTIYWEKAPPPSHAGGPITGSFKSDLLKGDRDIYGTTF